MEKGIIEVWIWGTRIGYLGYSPNQKEVVTFEYDDKFMKSGIQISPLLMQHPPKLHTFEHISFRSFHGLPGMIADSLPDKFGNQLIDQYMASKKMTSVTALDRLSYIGSRGMGALEYKPSDQEESGLNSGSLSLADLSSLAEMVITN